MIAETLPELVERCEDVSALPSPSVRPSGLTLHAVARKVAFAKNDTKATATRKVRPSKLSVTLYVPRLNISSGLQARGPAMASTSSAT